MIVTIGATSREAEVAAAISAPTRRPRLCVFHCDFGTGIAFEEARVVEGAFVVGTWTGLSLLRAAVGDLPSFPPPSCVIFPRAN